MEQVLPGEDPDADWDPIMECNELREAGDAAAARKILMDLCQSDLRCLYGYGLCLWRLNRRDEAAAVFRRMLWLNPADNQGIRSLAHRLEDGENWQP